MENREIKTNLVGKDELFNMLALGEATRLPVLFVGSPGVAKTQALIDYVAAKYGYDKDRVRNGSFIIELDEGTKSNEVKGRVNMKELLENKRYEIDAPITNAEFIMINEVDKGSSSIRNTMLSIMREKAVFLGSEVKKCKWTTFCASCNEISNDAAEAPFWDRFMLKHTVERVNENQMIKAWDTSSVKKVGINIPSIAEVKAETIDSAMMKKYLHHVFHHITDRTAMHIPLITKGVKLIWNLSDAEAIVKSCSIIVPGEEQTLASQLEDPDVVNIKSKINDIDSIKDDSAYLLSHVEQIENMIHEYSNRPDADPKTVDGMAKKLGQVLDGNTLIQKALNTKKQSEKNAADLAEAIEPSAPLFDLDGGVSDTTVQPDPKPVEYPNSGSVIENTDNLPF